MEKNEVKSKIVETEIEPGVKKIIIMEGKENTPLVPVPLIISGNIDSLL